MEESASEVIRETTAWPYGGASIEVVQTSIIHEKR